MKFVGCVIIVLLGIYVSCSPVKSPKVSFKDVRVEHIDFDEIGLALRFDVYNPNAFGGEISNMQYAVFIEDNGSDLKLLEAMSDEGVKIDGKSTTTVSVPVSLNYEDVAEILKTNVSRDRVNYRVKGKVALKTAFGDIAIPFEKKGDFPVFKKPALRLANFDVKPGLSKTKVSFDVIIENKNDFAVGLKDLEYSVKMWGEDVLDGSGGDIQIEPGGEAVLPMKASIKLAKLGDLLLQGITEMDLDYRVELKGVLANDWKDFDFSLVKEKE